MGNNKKIYENCKVEYDEEFGSVHVYTNEKTLYLYTKTDEDRQKVNNHDTLAASVEFLCGVIGSLMAIIIFGYTNLDWSIALGEMSFVSVAIEIVLLLLSSLMGIIFLRFFVISLVGEHILGLDRAYRNKKHWKIYIASVAFFIFLILIVSSFYSTRYY